MVLSWNLQNMLETSFPSFISKTPGETPIFGTFFGENSILPYISLKIGFFRSAMFENVIVTSYVGRFSNNPITFSYANISVFFPSSNVTSCWWRSLKSPENNFFSSRIYHQWPKLWSIETANSQSRISTDSNENQSNGKIRINDIKCEIYLLTFSSDKWPLKWAQIFCSRPELCEVLYRPIPLHTNVSV